MCRYTYLHKIKRLRYIYTWICKIFMRDRYKKVRDKIETSYIKIKLILELLLEIYYHRFGSTDLTTCVTWKSKEYIVWEYWANII